MKTMVAEPYVNHIPTMTGGVGAEELARFYQHHFVNGNPADTKLIPVSRTVGADRVVDEMLFCFTHDREIDWMLPGVAPTGKYVEVPLVAIVCFRGNKLYHEHIYWDQASVLAQIGLIDKNSLPVAGVEQRQEAARRDAALQHADEALGGKRQQGLTNMENPVLTKLRAGGSVGAMWTTLGAPVIAELMVEQGADAIVFDLQHGLWTRPALESAIGMTRDKATPLVRTQDDSYFGIGYALDSGALGVIVPVVETAEQAARIVAAAKYPPQGRRSSGGIRSVIDAKAVVPKTNDAIFVAAMIETTLGVENAAAIAAVPGIDMLFIGPFDLSLSMGTFPDFGPKHEAAMQSVLQAAHAAGKSCGLFTLGETMAADRRRQGFQMAVLAYDQDLIQTPSKARIRRNADVPGKDLVAGAVALVTGCNRGIGPETVRALLKGGAKKIYVSARKLDAHQGADRRGAGQAASDRDRRHQAGPDRGGGARRQGRDAAGQQCRHQFQHAAVRDREQRQCAARDGGELFRHARDVPRVPADPEGEWRRGDRQHAVDPVAREPAADGFAVRVQGGALQPDPGDARGAEGAGHACDGRAAGRGRYRHDGGRERAEDPAGYVAAAIVDGLKRRADEIYPGDMAAGVFYGLSGDPKAVEREFANYLPAARV